MATTETTSSTPEEEWMQFYQTNYFSDTNQIPSPPTDSSRGSYLSTTPNHGRVSKPLRRRARASRRTPTTLFNTDAANFRSLVQRFTGAPISPLAAARPQRPETDEAATAAVPSPDHHPAAGLHMQYSHQQYPLQREQVFTMQGGRGQVVSSHAPPGFSSSTTYHRDYSNYIM